MKKYIRKLMCLGLCFFLITQYFDASWASDRYRVGEMERLDALEVEPQRDIQDPKERNAFKRAEKIALQILKGQQDYGSGVKYMMAMIVSQNNPDLRSDPRTIMGLDFLKFRSYASKSIEETLSGHAAVHQDGTSGKSQYIQNSIQLAENRLMEPNHCVVEIQEGGKIKITYDAKRIVGIYKDKGRLRGSPTTKETIVIMVDPEENLIPISSYPASPNYPITPDTVDTLNYVRKEG